MIDEDEAGKPEGEALPESRPPQSGFFSSPASTPLEAVEAWYAQHFHKAAVEGRQPLSADDYAALKAAVSASSQQE